MSRLAGVRVLVTRPRDRSQDLCFLLEDEGAQVVCLPLLEVLPPQDERPLRAAAEQIHRYDWVAFASPAAVEALAVAVRAAGTWERLSSRKLAVVGPGTAKAVRALGLDVAVEAVPPTGAGLGASLRGPLRESSSVLLPVAEQGRADVEEALSGQARMVRVVAYRSEAVAVSSEAVSTLHAHPPAAVLFGSPRTVDAFVDAAGEALLRRMAAVAIGPTTAAALQVYGVPVVIAERPTAEALVDATAKALHR